MKLIPLLKFAFLKGFSLLGNLLLLYIFQQWFHWSATWAYGLALVLILLANYFIAGKWIFYQSPSRTTFGKYIVWVGLVSLISVPVFDVLIHFIQMPQFVAATLSLGLSFFLKYVTLEYLVFRTSPTKKRWLVFDRRYSLILIATILFFTHFCLNILNTAWDSDYVTTFLLYPHFFHEKVFISSNTMFYKYLYYFPVQLLFGFTRRTILVVGLINALWLWTSFVWFYQRFLKTEKNRIQHALLFVPLLLLSTLSWPFFTYLAHPFIRNSEIGFYFLILLLFLTPIQQKKQFILKALSVFVLSTVLIFSDPIFIFALSLPAILTLGVQIWNNKHREKQNIFLALIPVATTFALSLQTLLPRWLPFIINDKLQTGFIVSQEFYQKLLSTVLSVQYLFGADFWGQPIQSLLTVSILARLFYVLLGLMSIYLVWQKRKEPVATLLVFSQLTILGAYLFSTLNHDVSTSRYLILLPFLFTLNVGELLRQNVKHWSHTKIQVTWIAASLLVTLNIWTLSPQYTYQKLEAVHQEEFAIINALHDRGVRRGYADFWQAGIITYLAQNQITSRQISCNQGTLRPFRWAATQAWFEPQASERSFLLLAQTPLSAPFYDASCTEAFVTELLGTPAEILTFTSTQGEKKTLYIFSYDIASKFAL